MEEQEEEERLVKMGSYDGMVKPVADATEEIMLLWGMQQPTFSKQNAFVHQSSLTLQIDSCGHSLSILQSPSCLGTPGVTGSVMWDSGIVLGKFLEHSVDSGTLTLQNKKAIELGSGCGLVGCIAAILGARVLLTDLPDRLRLLRKNVETNLGSGNLKGSASVNELTWGDEPDPEVIEPIPDYVLGSDVIFSEGAVMDLLTTLRQLCGNQTTILLAGELRNGKSPVTWFFSCLTESYVTPYIPIADAVLEYFLEAAMKDFAVGLVNQMQWHPDYRSARVAMYILVKKAVVEVKD